MNVGFLRKITHVRKDVISMIGGMVFAAYFICVSVYLARLDGFCFAMISVGVLWIALSIKKGRGFNALGKLPRFIKWFLKCACIVLIASFVIVEGIIIYDMQMTPTAGAEYLIILGCQVDGSTPSRALARRVDVATRYLKENQNTNVVVSGGRGRGENISEAEAMKRRLVENGIEGSRIFEEQKSRSTVENLRYSDERYDLSDKKVVIVSSDYHMFRALSSAKKLNYENVEGLPSRSALPILPAYLLREYVTVMSYISLGRM